MASPLRKHVFLAAIALSAQAFCLSSSAAGSPPDDYIDSLFRWSEHVSPGCSSLGKGTNWEDSALSLLEKRLPGPPDRATAKRVESCDTEVWVTVAFSRSRPTHVQFWLFVFSKDGRLLREQPPE
jgi:hypothetical protein